MAGQIIERPWYLKSHGKVSRIHRREPKGKPMPEAMARSNALKSAVRSKGEPVFAPQKARMGLRVRAIGIARATATIVLVNMTYNMSRWCWLEARPVTGQGPGHAAACSAFQS